MLAGDLTEVLETQKKMEALDMNAFNDGKKSKKPVVLAQKYMADNLSLWESFVGADGRNIRLFKIPPPLLTIPVRPFILDSVSTHIEKPDLKHRKPVETQSVMSRIFGWK